MGGFRGNRLGTMAQQFDDGFGSDGSWYYAGESTGQKRPFDYQFEDTLKQVRYGTKAFFHAKPLPDSRDPGGISSAHLDAFAEIYCRLKARGIATFVFISPLSVRVLEAMREREGDYQHLFRLREALAASRETSSLHLDILRDLKRINAHLTSVAHPILDEDGLLFESRLRSV